MAELGIKGAGVQSLVGRQHFLFPDDVRAEVRPEPRLKVEHLPFVRHAGVIKPRHIGDPAGYALTSPLKKQTNIHYKADIYRRVYILFLHDVILLAESH